MKRLALLLPVLVVACTNDYDQFTFTDDGGGAAASGGASGGSGGGGGSATGGAAGASGGAAGSAGTAGTGTGGSTGTSCQDIYGNAQGVDNVCDDQPASCDLAYNAHVATCSEICQAGGGQCTDVFNNQGPCGHGQPANCGTTQFNSAICVCSK